MTNFDYKENDSWGNIGWLGTDDYYSFWGDVFAHDLVKFFQGKVIIDIGSGNGLVWQKAIDTGLFFKELHLIDPALSITQELSEFSNVIQHVTTLCALQETHGDVVVFKQSIHHVYEGMGKDMFTMLKAKTFINFSMPAKPNWPMSEALNTIYAPSCINVRDLIKDANKDITDSFMISYPVEMSRENWCLLLRKRFTSILHDCDEDFINREVTWANKNLPDKLAFLDTLECLIFE